jgi:hypothetical protein
VRATDATIYDQSYLIGKLITDPSLRSAPKGFNPVEDLTDGYRFLYPFGWQVLKREYYRIMHTERSLTYSMTLLKAIVHGSACRMQGCRRTYSSWLRPPPDGFQANNAAL